MKPQGRRLLSWRVSISSGSSDDYDALWLGISSMIGIEQAFFYFPTWIKTGPFYMSHRSHRWHRLFYSIGYTRMGTDIVNDKRSELTTTNLELTTTWTTITTITTSNGDKVAKVSTAD